MPTRYLTPLEVAERLQVPLSTVYAWNYKRTGPPSIKVGRHRRYDESALDRWLAEQTTPAAS